MSVDGLTTETLRRSRQAFWDDYLTELLVDALALPADRRRLIDIGCGLATAAHVLVPRCPTIEYVGVDPDAARLAEAARDLPPRTRLVVGRGERLPFADASIDRVLMMMTLQHVLDPAPLLAEIRRVLARDGGRVVAIEPDNLGQRYYWNGVMVATTAAFHALSVRIREQRWPRDLAIGPRVPSLLAKAGLADITVRVHAMQAIRHEPARAFAERLRGVARTIASFAQPAGEADDERRDCDAAIDTELLSIDPNAIGISVNTVPVFVCAASAQSSIDSPRH